jgi:hypothetical protein
MKIFQNLNQLLYETLSIFLCESLIVGIDVSSTLRTQEFVKTLTFHVLHNNINKLVSFKGFSKLDYSFMIQLLH